MNTLNLFIPKKKKIRINLSLGNQLVEEKKKYFKLKENKSRTFNEALNKLNRTLRKSESLLHMKHFSKKIDIDSLFPKREIIYLKKKEYHKKWKIKYNFFPVIEHNNSNNNQNKEYQNSTKSRNTLKFFGSFFRSNSVRNNNNKSSEDKSNIPYYLRGFEPKKDNINAHQIVRDSMLKLNKKDHFKTYMFYMGEKVEKFMDYINKFSNYYQFDEKIKKNIKDAQTGITIPGNVVNRESTGFIRTIQPKHIKINIKRNIIVPEKTLIPIPKGLAGKNIKYTHITKKKEYSENQKLI